MTLSCCVSIYALYTVSYGPAGIYYQVQQDVALNKMNTYILGLMPIIKLCVDLVLRNTSTQMLARARVYTDYEGWYYLLCPLDLNSFTRLAKSFAYTGIFYSNG